MTYRFLDLINPTRISVLLEKLCRLTGIPLILADQEGRQLAVSKKQAISRFPRIEAMVDAACVHCDQLPETITANAPSVSVFTTRNGLTASVAPVIIEGRVLARIYMGFFFLDNPDPDYFTNQAIQLGYDADEYLAAIRLIPVLTQQQVAQDLAFVQIFVGILAELGLDKLRELMIEKEIREVKSEMNRQQQFQILTENASDMIAMMYPDRIFQYVSPASMLICGFEPSEIIGRPISDFYHPDDRETLERIYQEIMEQPKPLFTLSFRCLCKDGSYTWVESNLRPKYREQTGELISIQSSTRDISARIKLENELIAARNAADQANAAKSEFLANMSHEIRTPLNAVIGFSELLAATSLDSRQRSYTDAISSAGHGLLLLINDILDLSKIEAGMMELQLSPVNPRSLFREMEQIFRQKIRSKNLKFMLQVDRKLPDALLLDETRLRQILLNLVGNAIKFTDHGHVAIQVDRAEDSAGDDSRINLVIRVSDTGIGIPESQSQAIFESFRQQTGQSNRKYGGTGLGLSITKRLVEMMHGEISVASVVGEGSTFTVNINHVDIAVADALPPEQTTVDLGSRQFARATILVVDDVESNRLLIKELLTRKGLDVTTAENGFEAVMTAGEILPDLILMDIRMPIMDGYEAFTQLRANEATRTIKIIALTASSSLEKDKRNLEFDDYLAKPVTSQALYTSLLRFLPLAAPDGSDEYAAGGEQEDEPAAADIQPADEAAENPTAVSDDLKDHIIKELLPVVNRLSIVLKVNQVKTLAAALEEAGRQYQVESLLRQALLLSDALQSFDIERIRQTLSGTAATLNNLVKGS